MSDVLSKESIELSNSLLREFIKLWKKKLVMARRAEGKPIKDGIDGCVLHIADDTIEKAMSYWEVLKGSVDGVLPLPIVIPTEEGLIQFAWRTDLGVLSVDIDTSGKVEWFHRNKSTGKYWSEEMLVGDPPSPRTRKALKEVQEQLHDTRKEERYAYPSDR